MRLLVILFFLCPVTLIGQLDTISIYFHITQVYNSVNTKKNGKQEVIVKYIVDNKSVNKKEYLDAVQESGNIQECYPCYLISYNEDRVKVYEGMHWSDFCFGEVKKYYKTGELKSIIRFSSFKDFEDSNMKDNVLINEDAFPIEHGKSEYYNRNGDLAKYEIYDIGTLVETKILLELDVEEVKSYIIKHPDDL